jgi:hypothetical protein
MILIERLNRKERDSPAPVVPPPRLDESIVGDWCIERSRSPIVNSKRAALGSTKPRLSEGMDCENRRNDSRYRGLAYSTSEETDTSTIPSSGSSISGPRACRKIWMGMEA